MGDQPPPAPPPPAPPPPPSAGPPPGWSQPAPGYQAQSQPTTNGLAIAALVLGIASYVLWFLAVPAILALVFGYIAKRQIDESQGAQGGRGLAIAGIILGWIWVGLFVVIIAVIIIIAAAGGFDTDNNDFDNDFGLALSFVRARFGV